MVEIGEGTEPDDAVEGTLRVPDVGFIAVCQRRLKISTKKENGSLPSPGSLLKPKRPKRIEIAGRPLQVNCRDQE